MRFSRGFFVQRSPCPPPPCLPLFSSFDHRHQNLFALEMEETHAERDQILIFIQAIRGDRKRVFSTHFFISLTCLAVISHVNFNASETSRLSLQGGVRIQHHIYQLYKDPKLSDLSSDARGDRTPTLVDWRRFHP